MTWHNGWNARMGVFVAAALYSTSLMTGCSDGGATTSTTTSGSGGNGGAGGMSSTGGMGGAPACGPNQELCGETCTDTQIDAANCGGCGKSCASGEVCSLGSCSLSCGGGTTQCGSSCIDTSNDPANCGACGTVCGAGEVCSAGKCALTCSGGSTQCDNLCVDVSNDPANCGACGTVCATGEVCSAGNCALTCSGGSTQCGNLCVDVSNDPANCGMCGTVCATGEVCSAGNCALSCSGGTTKCGNACVDVSNDPANCGMCGTVCAAGEVCSAGNCALSCSGGTTKCGNACVDVSNDPANCGMCGTVCAAGEVCSAGNCALSCSGGTTKCGNACVDVSNDPANCGMCGTVCASGEVCSAGNCALSCSGGTTKCGNACVDVSNDPANCGMCGTVCAAGEVCSAGNCGLLCTGGTTQCGNACVNTSSDPANCGMCGNACGPYPSATPVCSAGSCVAICAPGSADCNGMLPDGCETTPASDPQNCGFCGNVCPNRPNATPSCSNNFCTFACNTGFGNCNSNSTDGCEVDLQTSVMNCGFCDNACPVPANASATCANGACGFSCNAGFTDCNNNPADGCESNPLSDTQNCGMCGNACSAGQSCQNGTCSAGSIRQLAGTHTNDVTRGNTWNSLFADPVTGKVYWHAAYTGNTLSAFPDVPSFVSNTNATTITLAVGYEGTYHAALNGFLYYNEANTSNMVKVDAVTGQLVTSVNLPNAGHSNQSHFNWGGYSDIAFYTDTGNLLYVMYAATGGNTNIQVSRLDPNSLGIQQTWTIPRIKVNTGFAFLVNGNFYIGQTYSSPAIIGKYNLGTSTYDSAYTNSLSPVTNDYVAHTYWDPGSKNLFEVTNGHHLIYPNVQ